MEHSGVVGVYRPRRGRMCITAGGVPKARNLRMVGCESASSKRANVGRVGLLVFALFEDASALFRYPQVSFASLSSPAVMDLRRLRRRLGWAAGVRPLRGRFSLVCYPQVSFASLSSPAVMDLRRLRRRLRWAAGVRPLRGRFSLVLLSAGYVRFALFTRG